MSTKDSGLAVVFEMVKEGYAPAMIGMSFLEAVKDLAKSGVDGVSRLDSRVLPAIDFET